ncbi:LysR family transcriptional regulator [Bacterioplanes sanyensis]|uniref:LysR family transcriptional regulator n=1 Tax=Bacterioplanes sanyensis TaxID=1249553 RepID=A0A222FII0_9GAMM|nr:LysR family transcriptional regulator [Bacterioplanes sanyensis]ASP38857.1 LysR family transcriptional regulator [Bacterioplanes sanyensis]
MDIRHLRYFKAVSDCGSFTRAAEQLHIAQPALSMAIRKLEAELELTLLHRRDRRVRLTDEGQRLYLHAQRMVQASEDAKLEMAELKGLQRGEVRVGVSSMLGSYYFPPVFMAFRQQYPQLTLSVTDAGTDRLRQLLLNGELDLAVIVDEDCPSELQAERFLSEQMLVTCGQDHPFATQHSIRSEDFFAQDLLLFKEGFFHRKVVERMARDGGFKPRISVETNLITLIKTMVSQGFGVSTLLPMVIDKTDNLITRSFAQPVWLHLSLAWRKDGYLSQANRTFADFMLGKR